MENSLIFSDVLGNKSYRWREGCTEVFLDPSGGMEAHPDFAEPGSNGMALDPKGRLLICQHGMRRVIRLETDGRQTVIADQYEGKRLNSPNDVVAHSSGAVYFTDPPYGLAGRNDSPIKELPWNGVYRATDGNVTLLLDDLPFPNGLAFNPDETVFYVAVSEPGFPRIVAYDHERNGTLSNPRLFFDARSLMRDDRPGGCDGFKVDARGNVFTTAPGGIVVLTPAGEHLGTILTEAKTANCNWGEDGGTLFIAAHTRMCRLRTRTNGTANPPRKYRLFNRPTIC